MKLAALKYLKNDWKCCDFIFDWIFFILADYKENHKISDGFKILLDQMLDCGVSCPWVSGKIPIVL